MKTTESLTELIAAKISKGARVLPRVTSNELSDLADRLRYQGRDILTLCGTPYWAPPEYVREATQRVARENLNAPSKGFPELRQAISNWLEKDKIAVDPKTEILVTNGAMHALSLIFTTLLDPNDEVVMYRPGFFFFGPIRLAGGVPVYAETKQATGWRWDAKALEDAISSKTKLIVINSPTNPTGYLANEGDLLAVAEIARKYDLLVVSDESYDNMVYDEGRYLRAASIREMSDRTITVCSFTKTFALQPWRVGFVAAPSHLTEYFQKVLEWNVLRCSHVAQWAARAALEGPQVWVSEIASRFQRSRDLMMEGLKSAGGIAFVTPKGAPFLFLNVSQLGFSGTEFSLWLLNEYGVPTDPGTFFGSDSHVRLPFGGSDEVVQEAAKRIVAANRTCLEAPPNVRKETTSPRA
jgi:aspartate aminotransferase/aminotransferase